MKTRIKICFLLICFIGDWSLSQPAPPAEGTGQTSFTNAPIYIPEEQVLADSLVIDTTFSDSVTRSSAALPKRIITSKKDSLIPWVYVANFRIPLTDSLINTSLVTHFLKALNRSFVINLVPEARIRQLLSAEEFYRLENCLLYQCYKPLLKKLNSQFMLKSHLRKEKRKLIIHFTLWDLEKDIRMYDLRSTVKTDLPVSRMTDKLEQFAEKILDIHRKIQPTPALPDIHHNLAQLFAAAGTRPGTFYPLIILKDSSPEGENFYLTPPKIEPKMGESKQGREEKVDSAFPYKPLFFATTVVGTGVALYFLLKE